MKQLLIISLMLLAACTSKKAVQKQAPEINVNDSTQYELLVFDSGFESWYAVRNSPATYRSKDYYHNWNLQYVQEWNYRVINSRNSSIFGEQIDYHTNEDYPFEIEHKLFYYFQYVERELGIKLLRNGPQGIL